MVMKHGGIDVDSGSTDEGERFDRRPVSLLVVVVAALAALLIWFADSGGGTPTTPEAIAPLPTVPDPTTSSSSAGTSVPPSTSTTVGSVAIETQPLADLVPGVAGTLYVLQGSGVFEVVVWDSHGTEMTRTELPRGWASTLEFNSDGRRFAALTTDDASPQVSGLHVGTLFPLADMAMEVTSAVWHQTEPALMATVAVLPDRTRANLVTLEFLDELDGGAAAAIVAEVDVGQRVTAFGDWGFLLNYYDEDLDDDVVALLGPSGDQIWARQVNYAVVSPVDDILLASFDDIGGWEFRLVRPDTPATEPGRQLALSSDTTGMAWSSDGELLAVHVYEGGAVDWRLDVVDRQGSLISSTRFEWRVWGVEWSPDDRFVLMPGTDNQGTHVVLFYDTQTDTLTTVEFDAVVQWAGIEDAAAIGPTSTLGLPACENAVEQAVLGFFTATAKGDANGAEMFFATDDFDGYTELPYRTDDEARNRDTLLEYFQTRASNGARLELVSHSYHGGTGDQSATFGVGLRNEDGDGVSGSGAVNCRTGKIIALFLAPRVE